MQKFLETLAGVIIILLLMALFPLVYLFDWAQVLWHNFKLSEAPLPTFIKNAGPLLDDKILSPLSQRFIDLFKLKESQALAVWEIGFKLLILLFLGSLLISLIQMLIQKLFKL